MLSFIFLILFSPIKDLYILIYGCILVTHVQYIGCGVCIVIVLKIWGKDCLLSVGVSLEKEGCAGITFQLGVGAAVFVGIVDGGVSTFVEN